MDGVYVKAGLEKEKAAVLVVMAALSDGSKVVVSAVPGYRESIESWSDVLRDMRRRGLECPRLVVGDGHLGIWGALRNVYPQAAEQRCWNHKIVNVLAKLPKRQQDQAKLMLRTIPYAPTRTEAERLRTVFTRWCGDHSYEAASEALERDWDRMVTFYDFPKEHWGHLRTTNPVESPFAALRLRTDAAKRYKRVDRAIAVIWKMLMVAEQRFRRLKESRATPVARVPCCVSSRHPAHRNSRIGLRGPVRRLKTVRRPPIYPKTPGHLPCSSLTHPLPLPSRRPSVSFGGFGLSLGEATLPI